MTLLSEILLSLPIGVIGALIAKYVHPSWNLKNLLLFGLMVFAITVIIAYLAGKYIKK
jgi:predicted MFS family arabinose efflux permease